MTSLDLCGRRTRRVEWRSRQGANPDGFYPHFRSQRKGDGVNLTRRHRHTFTGSAN